MRSRNDAATDEAAKGSRGWRYALSWMEASVPSRVSMGHLGAWTP